MEKPRKHFDFDEIEEYLRNKTYPSTILAWDLNQIFEEQQNLMKWNMATYFIRKDWLSKTKNAKWKLSETCTEILEILNTSRQWPHTEEKRLRMIRLHKDFFGITTDINECVKSYEQCQKQGDLRSPNVELNSILVSSSVMKQVEVDICNLPEVGDYSHVIVLIDCFSK